MYVGVAVKWWTIMFSCVYTHTHRMCFCLQCARCKRGMEKGKVEKETQDTRVNRLGDKRNVGKYAKHFRRSFLSFASQRAACVCVWMAGLRFRQPPIVSFVWGDSFLAQRLMFPVAVCCAGRGGALVQRAAAERVSIGNGSLMTTTLHILRITQTNILFNCFSTCFACLSPAPGHLYSSSSHIYSGSC